MNVIRDNPTLLRFRMSSDSIASLILSEISMKGEVQVLNTYYILGNVLPPFYFRHRILSLGEIPFSLNSPFKTPEQRRILKQIEIV